MRRQTDSAHPESALQNMRGAIGNQQDQGGKEQNQSQGTRQAGYNNFPSMLAVDFGPGCHLGLVLRFESFLAIPPGTTTVKIISNVGRADDGHAFTTKFAVKAKYSTNFLVSIPSLLRRAFGAKRLNPPHNDRNAACEIFLT